MPTMRTGAAALALVLGSSAFQGEAHPLVGVWKVAEIASPQGNGNSNPQPTVYIFTARHYSHVSVTSATPRPNYTGPAVTDAQRVEMWQPFSATAGTYEVRGETLTMRPLVAKNPGFMAGGTFMTFDFVQEGRDIWIQPTRSQLRSFSSADANRVRLVRLE